MRLHLFHTNDFHGRLQEPQAERLRAERDRLAGAEPSLLLDAGDAVSAGNLGFHPFGEPILERMSALGYDAMTMGNRETHPTLLGVRTKLSKARFPVLCANGYARRAESLPFVPSVLLERAGLRIGIFGLTVPMATPKKADALLWDNLFESPLETARRQVELLRPQCELLIALTHVGIAQDRKLAEALPELDLIVGGHTHVVLEEPERVAGVPIVQAGSHARYFGHVMIDAGSVTGALYPL